MTGKGRAHHSGTHRSVHYLITESETAGIWRYWFSIGDRNFAGKVHAVLGLLAERRVMMNIDRVLRREVSRKAHTDGMAGSDVPRRPSRPTVARTASSATVSDGSKPIPPKAECPSTVAFTCEMCHVVYEAVQVRAKAKGLFRCTVCYWRVHQWDGAYDYRSWRQQDKTPAPLVPRDHDG